MSDPLDDALSLGPITPPSNTPRTPGQSELVKAFRNSSTAQNIAKANELDAFAHQVGVPLKDTTNFKMSCDACGGDIHFLIQGRYAAVQGSASCSVCGAHPPLEPSGSVGEVNYYQLPDEFSFKLLTNSGLDMLLPYPGAAAMSKPELEAFLVEYVASRPIPAVLAQDITQNLPSNTNGAGNANDADDDDEGEEWKNQH